MSRFTKYAWGVLGYTLLVILWGAYVRATGSGAGCGGDWPVCNGQVIPLSAPVATMIEYTHRLMSGLTLVFVLGMFVWAIRAYPKGSLVRRGAGLSLLFTCTEALVGAGLVLFQLVARNESVARAASVAIHLVNTLLLLASLSLTVWWSAGGGRLLWKGNGSLGLWIGIAWAGLILVGASGAITALGDTLFPAGSLAQGLQQDVSPTASFLIRLRVYHPMIAVTMGLYVALIAWIARGQKPSRLVRSLSTLQIGLFLFQLGLGGINVLLLAPIWMQMVHLFVADLVWICLIFLTSAVLGSAKQEELILEEVQYQSVGG